MASITLLTLGALATLSSPVQAFTRPYPRPYYPSSSNCSSSSLADYALEKVLSDAAPVFGVYEDVQSNTSTW